MQRDGCRWPGHRFWAPVSGAGAERGADAGELVSQASGHMFN